eukprot:CAMPEP_0197040940 /NCGR_PEP_ID=MMETSP1384-20130603/17559_1 /TAXON_ID=29189 /ORGANISM="Ammonia sp." /LENGTH=317 /DNA_ID=CAMNT_0042471783 /DNA_START=137 /DNA_END=1090 /DNA_ORIENTATION=-
MKKHGYFNSMSLCNSLQGSIWSSTKPDTNESVIIKVCNKAKHSQRITEINGKRYRVQENIFKERAILKSLTRGKQAPHEIVQYKDWFDDGQNYYLVMENGGTSLFDFVVKCHQYISIGKISIAEWHKFVQLALKQMVHVLHYMHSRGFAHFDFSLENMLINEVDVEVDDEDNFRFVLNDKRKPVQIKLCDFGLAEMFAMDDDGNPVFTTSKNAGKPNYKSPEMRDPNIESLSAAANDVWCLGVCLFMMLCGGMPFQRAQKDDKDFQQMIGGRLKQRLTEWQRTDYVSQELIDLLQAFMKYEGERITLAQLRRHPWLQ